MPQPLKILVRGSGDVASAVALRLFQAGYGVVMHDSSQPTATRRKMAFTDAIFDGFAALEGVPAQRADTIPALLSVLDARQQIPVTVLDLALVLAALKPDVLVDARMRKHSQPESQLHLAALTIGLGPNFSAGENIHLAVETGRGPSMGQVIARGTASPLQGEPKEIGGHARDRYVYAPLAGTFHTSFQIGAVVTKGQEIAQIDGHALHAPISGVLRGLTRDGVPVQLKTKIIEVDPRIEGAQVAGVAERPEAIAQGVLRAVWGEYL